MASVVARRVIVPIARSGLTNAQKLKYFKAGAWTSFAQEKIINYGYNRIPNKMAYRSRNRNRSAYARGARSYALKYYSRRGRRLATPVSSQEMDTSSHTMGTIATIGSVKKQIYDAKQRKVEVFSSGISLNTDDLYYN
ncbi:hypothetical protein, partial [Nocardia mangyaensis]|uniref:hypothetical protein n=1 Tax=Nocardia mangyaensis TaxID=2213200 RepID=UPI0026763FBD